MASGNQRPSKRQRTSSIPPQTNELNERLNGVEKEHGTNGLPAWKEPPLRQPQPSFMDHKGIERHGVLEHMMPLGTMPTAKVRARAKGATNNGLRRTVQARNLEGYVVEEARPTPERTGVASGLRGRTPAGVSTRASSIKPGDQSKAATPARETTPPAQPPVVVQDKPTTPPPAPVAQAEAYASAKSSPLSEPASPTPSPQKNQLNGDLNAAFQRVFYMARDDTAVGLSAAALKSVAQHRKDYADLLLSYKENNHTPEQEQLYREIYRSARKVLKSRNVEKKDQKASPAPEAAPSEVKQSSSSPPKLKLNLNPPANGTAAHQNAETAQAPPSPQRTTRLKLSMAKNQSSPAPPAAESHESPAENSEPVQPSADSARRASSSSLSSVDSQLVNEPPPAPAQSLKRPSAEVESILDTDDEEVEERRKRMKLDLVTDVPTMPSGIRRRINGKLQVPGPSSLRYATLPSPVEPTRPAPGKRPASALDGPATRSATASQPQTPTESGRPAKRARTAKTKISPIKNNKQASIAGIARPDGKRPVSPVNDDDSESDNNDFCSACGGSGYLVCCDGCDRSFHFTCLDPPLDQDVMLDEPWYCFICQANRAPQSRPPRGLFYSLFINIEKKNPTSFALPEDIREYFQGVHTGEDGEYLDVPPQKVSTRSRTGYDEVPDFQKLKDQRGNTILCFHCGKAADGRDIISCDFCPLHWHLDCLDPPRANPPGRASQNGKARVPWMCPAHVDHDLKHLDPIAGDGVQYVGTGRAHKIRRPKNPQIVSTHLRRGFKNNGLIEVDNDDDDNILDDSDWDEIEDGRDENGKAKVFRIPSKGIKLDFIDRVKANREREALEAFEQASMLKLRASELEYQNQLQIQRDIRNRTLNERRAIFSLAQLRSGNQDPELGHTQIDNLLNTLEAEAPNYVVAAAAADELSRQGGSGTARTDPSVPPSPPASSDQVDPAPPKDDHREKLLRLQRLIQRQLQSMDAGADAEADIGADS